jgi:hypothetical protein
MSNSPIMDKLRRNTEIFRASPEDILPLSHDELIHRSLYCYGMEYAMRKEAKRADAFGHGTTCGFCALGARDWLRRARYYRKLAEADEAICRAAEDNPNPISSTASLDVAPPLWYNMCS